MKLRTFFKTMTIGIALLICFAVLGLVMRPKRDSSKSSRTEEWPHTLSPDSQSQLRFGEDKESKEDATEEDQQK